MTVFLLVLAALFCWAFLTTKDSYRYTFLGGLCISLALAGVAGYFAWREARTLAELAVLIDPLPEVTEVIYMPTAGEVAAISQFLAAIPGGGRMGTTQAERSELADRARERHTDYWLIKTSLSPDAVLAFSRKAAAPKRWVIEKDESRWLQLSRGAETLMIFVADDFPRPGVKVLYGFSSTGNR